MNKKHEEELEALFDNLKKVAEYNATQYKKMESIVLSKIKEIGSESELFELLEEIDKKKKASLCGK